MRSGLIIAGLTRGLPAVALAVVAMTKLIGGWHDRYSTPFSLFYAAAAIEAIVAALLSVRRTARIGSALCILLMVAFGSWAIGSGNVGDCGCFGDVLPATPALSVRIAAALGLMCLSHLWLTAPQRRREPVGNATGDRRATAPTSGA